MKETIWTSSFVLNADHHQQLVVAMEPIRLTIWKIVFVKGQRTTRFETEKYFLGGPS